MTDSASDVRPKAVAKRKRLALLLAQAAELEHAAMCMYLFASSTMKSTVAEGGVTLMQLETMRQWRAHMMVVAREEMEHLGIVLNLLSAIGEAPVLRRRNFPFTVEYGGDTLDLSLNAIDAQLERWRVLSEKSASTSTAAERAQRATLGRDLQALRDWYARTTKAVLRRAILADANRIIRRMQRYAAADE